MISLRDISYTYPQRGSKAGFNFSCRALDFPLGEISLLVGPNGSGKTTLTRLMCGVLRPNQGRVLIRGQDVAGWPLGRIGAQVGYLLQEPRRQLFRPQVWQEMIFTHQLLGRDHIDTDLRAEALLKEFGLWELRLRATLNLSRGEQQRLALAALLMGEAKFFILDEPSSGLDRENRRILYHKLEELRQRGYGFAIASHDPELLRRWPGRQLRLQQGRVEL